jgi:hypothetical protein
MTVLHRSDQHLRRMASLSGEIHMGTHDLSSRWHESQLNPVDDEIAKLASICNTRILDPGIVERVVAGDASVCGRKNEKAFQKLRKLVGLHYTLTNDSVAALGPEASGKILDQIRERLAKRFELGGDRS